MRNAGPGRHRGGADALASGLAATVRMRRRPTGVTPDRSLVVAVIHATLLVACSSSPPGRGDDTAPTVVAPATTPGPAHAEPPSDPRPRANLHMARRLAALTDDPGPKAMHYRNRAQAARLARQLQTGGPMVDTLRFRLQLITELLRSGRTIDAIDQLEKTSRALQRAGDAVDEEVQRAVAGFRGIAYLRLGEQENCIRHHGSDSCIVPIRGDGVHRLRRGSVAAVDIYTSLLARQPDDLSARWLLNLAHMTLGQYPQDVPRRWLVPPEVFASEHELPRFRDVAGTAGVARVGLSGGCVLDDLNGDGLLDVMASSWGLEDQLRYFESSGDGTFVDRTAEAYLTGQVGGLNLTHADYDNDGDADVLVLRGAWLGPDGAHPNSLLRNDGRGRFEDVTEAAGVLSFHPTQTAAWSDFDNDGWLDLFVGNESSQSAGARPCELYRNNGDGTFTDVAAEVGLDHVGLVKAVAWGDYDNDGLSDLYLSRFGQPNLLFRNRGPGDAGQEPPGGHPWRFEDVTEAAGVARPIQSFPAWFFDYDNDGWLDLLVASFESFAEDALATVVADYLGLPSATERCRLYRNRRNGTFEDVSREAGVDRVLLAMGANFGDLDGDGFLDVYLGTGQPSLLTLVPNVMLRNDSGRRFQDVTTAGGFGNVQKGHGIAFGDVDNDGDQDIYAVMGGAFDGDVYQNILFENPGTDAHWLTLQLRGRRTNRLAVGARVRVVAQTDGGERREVHRVVGTGGSFGSSSLQLEIGLGQTRRVELLEVYWPVTGEVASFHHLPVDQVLRIREGEPEPETVALPRMQLGRDVSRSHDGGQRHAR